MISSPLTNWKAILLALAAGIAAAIIAVWHFGYLETPPGAASLPANDKAAKSMEDLISAAASTPAQKPDLFKALMKGHVLIIASWNSPDSKEMTIQDFNQGGRPFLPVFSDQQHFAEEAKGSGFEKKGVSIDANLLASILQGTETLILNPGSKTPVEFQASEIKKFMDLSRLPKL